MRQEGTGRRYAPYRYGLPGREEKGRQAQLELGLEEVPPLPEHLEGLSEREVFKRAKAMLEGKANGMGKGKWR